MIKTAAFLFGIVFILIGILGFVPGVTDNQMLLGVFHVNAVHNVVHLLSGAAALFAGMASAGAARIYFRVFGVIYGLVAVMGFMMGDGMLLGMISNNTADTWLHVGIAAVSLLLGFLPASSETV
jgi:hypothetical protein